MPSTYIINLKTGAVTEVPEVHMESAAGNFAATNNGLAVIGGHTDNGMPIRASITSAPVNFTGSDDVGVSPIGTTLKRPRAVYVSTDATAGTVSNVQVSTVVGQVARTYQAGMYVNSGQAVHRAVMNSGTASSAWVYKVALDYNDLFGIVDVTAVADVIGRRV
jgi:hypothetical protein